MFRDSLVSHLLDSRLRTLPYIYLVPSPAFVFTFKTANGREEGNWHLHIHLYMWCFACIFSLHVDPNDKYGDSHLLSKKWRHREVKSLVQGGATKKWWKWFQGPSFTSAIMTSRIRNTFFFWWGRGGARVTVWASFSITRFAFSLDEIFTVDHLFPLIFFSYWSLLGHKHLEKEVGFLEASDCQEIPEHPEV